MASDIAALMSGGITGAEVGLLGYWPLNETTGTTATDVSGNGNDGTVNGATWVEECPGN